MKELSLYILADSNVEQGEMETQSRPSSNMWIDKRPMMIYEVDMQNWEKKVKKIKLDGQIFA